MTKIAKEPSFERPAGGPRGAGASDPDFQIEYRDSVGAILRRAREGFGEDLSFVATSLKIRYLYLQAIEEQRYDDLPGPTYAVGFVRTYAEYLGLDAGEMVRLFKEEVEGIDRRQELVFPTPAPESKVPGGAVILLSLILIAVAYGGWFYLTSQEETVAELVPPVPEELRGLIAEDQTPTVEPPVSATVAARGPAVRDPAERGPNARTAPPTEPLAAPESAAVEPPIVEPPAPESVSAVDAVAAPPPASGQTPDSSASEAVASELPVAEPGEALANATDGAGPEAAEAALPAPMPAPRPLAGTEGPAGGTERSAATGGDRVTLASVLNSGRAAPSEVQAEVSSDEIPAAPQTTQLAALANEPPPQVYGADNEDARIVLRARQDSFVQIRAEDELLMTRVLRRGDEYRVPNRDGLTLLTGNAGGIEFVVDGAALQPLGPVGAVRSNVMLDPERLVEGTALLP